MAVTTEMTREELLAHVARCVACGACDTTILISLESTSDDELAEHVRLSHDRVWRSIERMDGVVSASPIEQADLVIGAELADGATVFIEIQPA